MNRANFTIREAKPADAKALNAYNHEIFSTAEYLITRPNEFQISRWAQRRWIKSKLDNPSETCLIAYAGDELVATLDCWTDFRARVRHSTTFGMSVKKGWRCRGIGKEILATFITWVKAHKSLERIELHVHSDNIHAIELYQSFGFELEGTRKRTIRYEDGRVVDDHIMALWP